MRLNTPNLGHVPIMNLLYNKTKKTQLLYYITQTLKNINNQKMLIIQKYFTLYDNDKRKQFILEVKEG